MREEKKSRKMQMLSKIHQPFKLFNREELNKRAKALKAERLSLYDQRALLTSKLMNQKEYFFL